MKKVLLSLLIMFVSLSLFAQEYPEIPFRDINYVEPDSLLFYGGQGSEPVPPLVGDTVIVTGVIMNAPKRGADPDSADVLHAGAQSVFLQDPNYSEWGGVLCRDVTGSADFAILDTGIVVKVTGVIVEYFTTTELDLIKFEASDIVGQQPRPQPVVLTLDSLFEKGTTNPKYLAEKWEGVYVEFHNVTVTEPNAVGSGTFKIFDENGTEMVIYNKSDYYRSSFTAPLAGTKIDRIRGFIETRTGSQYGWFMLNPIYFNDIKFGDVSPPNILNAERNSATVGFGQEVTVTAQIIDADKSAAVQGATLFYSANEGDYQEIEMTLIDEQDSIWSGTIPAFNDSTLVTYYIESIDEDVAVSTSPSGGANNPYFYFVLDRDLKIADVQKSPFGTGYSAYNGYEVTVSGVVTADTTDIEGDNANISPQVYIQDGRAPWSAIQVFGTEADNLRRGDQVTVTGIVNEEFDVTRIGTLDNGVQVTVNQSGVELPEPVVLGTGDIAATPTGELPAESYEGMLVKYEGLTVIDENADGAAGPDEGSSGNRNFGEILVADRNLVSTRLELQDGTHDYHNYWDFLLEDTPIRVKAGDTFTSITGILFFSFGNYKLVPRKNDDFEGHTPVVSVDEELSTPDTYALSQNYPNPFNPSTIIEYALPEAGNVKINIFNILGQKISTLVNETKSAGRYQVTFDATKLSTGIYFYSLEANNFRSIKKMLLIK